MITWYAAHTQPQAELKALDNLRRQGYATYLPRYRRWVRHARQRTLVLRPLFPRYIFVGLDGLTTRWRPILSTIGIAGLVCSGDRPVPVADEIVETLRERERQGAFDESVPIRRLQPGDAVRITEQPFQELVGRFVEMADDERVYILLDLLGRSVRAKVSASAVEAA